VKKTKKAKDFGAARREPRVQLFRELHMIYEGVLREVPIRPPDISLHGMFVNTSTHFAEGAVVNLRFRLTQSNVEVQTRAEVRYCIDGIGIGVEFVGIRSSALRVIEQEIRASTKSRTRKA
jgi:hypothetical protein